MTTAAKILGYLGLKPADNLGVEEENTILTVSIEKFTNPPSEYLGGPDALRQIEVRQWLSFAKKSRDSFSRSDTSSCDSMMKVLDETLRSKSYIVGTNITLADAVVYHLLGDFVDVINLSTYLHVQRWFDHVQHIFRRNDKTIRLISIPKKVSLISLISTPATAEESNRSASTATSSATPGTTQALQKAPPAAATASAPAAVAASDESGKVKKEKQKAEKPASSAPAQAPAPSKAVKPVAPVETSAADPSSESSKQDPSKLDIRCGKVVKCWNHPESDKLLCEEIDVNDGPGVLRTIASGIRSAYSAEQLEGRMVLVLCNLKERAIAGFKSQGMVLCASSADHTVIRLVEPPAGTPAGARVTFPGFEGEPATAAQVAKKKILEGLLPDLRTDSNGVATWQAVPFTIGAEACRSELPDARIS